MQHELKCVLAPFQIKWDGMKDWEFRKNDRDYRVGDTLLEREYNSDSNSYSGREIIEEVLWILPGGQFGVPDDYIIMSTKEISRKEKDKEPIHSFDYKKLYEIAVKYSGTIKILQGYDQEDGETMADIHIKQRYFLKNE
jgi:hypothetical protein